MTWPFAKTSLWPGRLLLLLLLCSCATENPAPSRLPADVTMDAAASRGDMLFVTVRLADGKKLPLLVDTGCSVTMFDQSLAPKLGKRAGPGTMTLFGVKHDVDGYPAPRLYWGTTPLLTGNYIVTLDCRPLSAESGHRQMGILGMDVLAHYCMQLDFAARKIRFLDDQSSDKTTWGKPFPLTDLGDGCLVARENLSGLPGRGSLIDTGCNSDGWLRPNEYQHWTNHLSSLPGQEGALAAGALGGETYPNLDLHELDPKLLASGDGHLEYNGIGLHALSRNLVTLDFPARTMYLKRTSLDPLPDPAMQATAQSEGRSALRFLRSLNRRDHLPGWGAGDVPASSYFHFYFHYPDTVTLDQLQKKGDPSVYHYQVSRPGKSKPWRLIKAWRTDKDGHTLEEYPLP